MDNPWLSLDYLRRSGDEVWEHLVIHASLTVQALAIAIAVAFPLAVLARRVPRLAGPILGTAGVLYTVPSLALFALLAPYTGIGRTTVLIGLVIYALLVLVRNMIVGLEGVDPDVVDAARGQGYSRTRLLLTVELPNALPSIVAGLRIAAVTTVALVTVGVVVGYGGLGQLMFRGLQSNYHAQIMTATLLCLALALVMDLAIVLLARWAMPWARSGRRARGRRAAA
ncbi:ABC transporter permease [Demequina lignilytica]|uniref:ABC transporter permease n=1 Tax=Demequina lignilytica TaxID=3051663 RepID=A0AAW7M9P8_9MICO|nr:MULTISPECIES: ABC transporter permease [unclassified Demequina]MDN4479291.1 ABC transporter permease [Demequina sp. SYSU T00039-1]MDN4483076.1 ABC transporter permease [Demequina sp. SYSU T0a273]MDN4488750.1 ABC transporter permease [Demequina sp. SYSU T00039]MDN4490920.1 ABC transporter permease [Demequina sp. SYSU T00068]